MVLPPEQADFINFSKNSPLKIRGARGVMKIIIEITPFIPLILRGKFKERGSFGI
jgi:hypothetical protein